MIVNPLVVDIFAALLHRVDWYYVWVYIVCTGCPYEYIG